MLFKYLYVIWYNKDSYKGPQKSVANYVTAGGAHWNPTGIPLVIHRNHTGYSQESHWLFTALKKIYSIKLHYRGVVWRGAPRGVTPTLHSNSSFQHFIPAVETVMLRRPSHPRSFLLSFFVLVFLVFPLRHYHLLRFLFYVFLVSRDLSFLP